MKTDHEIMQQALEVMELLSQQPIKIALAFVDNAIAALRERLAHCDRCGKPLSGDGDIHTCSPQMRENETVYAQPEQNWIDELVKVPDHVWAQREQEQESVRDLLISAAAMAVVMLRNGTYQRASDVADAVLDREVVPQPEQEPVAEVKLMMTGGNAGIATRIVEIDDPMRERLRPGQMLYTAPPQRKPLTDEEIEACRQQGFAHRGLTASFDFVKAARAVEAKLKENT